MSLISREIRDGRLQADKYYMPVVDGASSNPIMWIKFRESCYMRLKCSF